MQCKAILKQTSAQCKQQAMLGGYCIIHYKKFFEEAIKKNVRNK